MTPHARAVILAQTCLLCDQLAVACDPVQVLDELLLYPEDQVPDGQLAGWVRNFLSETAVRLAASEDEFC